MYIQPYEPQEFGLGASSMSGYAASGEACTPPETPFGGDSVTRSLPWTQTLPGLTDASGSLDDAPFGSLGLGGMLSNLTGMMQQLVQMMQSLLGRMSNGNAGGMTGQCGGCTQPSQLPGQRFPLDASPTTLIEE